MNKIQVLGVDNYQVKSRGMTLTIRRNPPTQSTRWTVYIDSPIVRAYRRGICFKWFDTLQQIEASYKSFKGLCALHQNQG